jgi:hypothetical protein
MVVGTDAYQNQIKCKDDDHAVWLGPHMCGLAREYLIRLGGYCSAPPGQCSLITCEYSCAWYICNKVHPLRHVCLL